MDTMIGKFSVRERKDCDQEDIVMAQEWTLKKFGERMAEKIVIGRYGAYLVDNAHIRGMLYVTVLKSYISYFLQFSQSMNSYVS